MWVVVIFMATGCGSLYPLLLTAALSCTVPYALGVHRFTPGNESVVEALQVVAQSNQEGCVLLCGCLMLFETC